jgi:hypothetical protein
MSWDMQRVRRAIERVFKEKVRAIDLHDGRRYLIPSSSTPGMAYMVQADPQTHSVQCDCPAGEAADPCKHGVLVMLLRRSLAVPHDLAHLVPKDMVAFLAIEPAPAPALTTGEDVLASERKAG